MCHISLDTSFLSLFDCKFVCVHLCLISLSHWACVFTSLFIGSSVIVLHYHVCFPALVCSLCSGIVPHGFMVCPLFLYYCSLFWDHGSFFVAWPAVLGFWSPALKLIFCFLYLHASVCVSCVLVYFCINTDTFFYPWWQVRVFSSVTSMVKVWADRKSVV